ncbi:nucleotidyltransferase domain-containing protein [Parapedobacter soli]|uniref:nucleotidyltransferase domain-containing protein n=1 Tax=Parapedobacter soli TaxID=416955 RepID=UPI0021C86D0F|nr:nucleotidyltransferase domain-containing protein [Parapedobacter soli]
MNFLTKHIDAIRKLCSKHYVKQLYAFGSVLTHRFDTDSDVALIVDFDSVTVEDYAEQLLRPQVLP